MHPDIAAAPVEFTNREKPSAAPRYIDAYDLALQRLYLEQQYKVLRLRHTVETIFMVRVLAEYHADSVARARNGGLNEARAQLEALMTIDLPEHLEIKSVVATSACPALALVTWMEGAPDEAIRQLGHGLEGCAILAGEYCHSYLTAKRIHLAANIARVRVSMGCNKKAIAEVGALRSVLSGQHGCWSYPGSETLSFPLTQGEHRGLLSQLDRIERLTAGAAHD